MKQFSPNLEEILNNAPENDKRAFDNAQRILGEAFLNAQRSSKEYSKELKRRKYLAYCLKFISALSAIMIITWPSFSREFAITILVIYGVDQALSNNKRLISIAQAVKAYEGIVNKIVRTHQTSQGEIFRIENYQEIIQKLTDLNLQLTKEANLEFEIVEKAIDTSDIETLQALSLDEEKLKIAQNHI